MIAAAPALEGWVPIRAYGDGNAPLLDWCYVGAERFCDPFFDATIDRCMRLPFNQLFRRQLPIDEAGSAATTSLSPAGLIFHVSRCGSTLVSQMLAAVAEHRVLSEAEPIDGVLRFERAGAAVSPAERIEWLRTVVSALGRPAGSERRLFIKLDCWHVGWFELIRAAYPGVPCVFLYRDPCEVLASQLRERAFYLVPGALEPAAFPAATAAVDPAEYCSRVLATFYTAMLQHAGAADVLLVNYAQLPHEAWRAVLEHFGLSTGDESMAAYAEAARHDAKAPALPYDSDSGGRRSQRLAAPQQAWCERLLVPLYAQLESLRARTAAAVRPRPK